MKDAEDKTGIAITSMRPLGKDKVPKMFAGAVVGDSPKVYITDEPEKALEYIDKTILSLISDKIRDIVILTCTTIEKSVILPYLQDGKYRKNGHEITVSTCRKYKGLEADSIILIDVTADTFDNHNKLMFYVGASRARFRLNVVCNMNEDECIQALEELDIKDTKKPKKTLAAALNSLLSL